jgi:7,8-dihydropterin-6-yl-methyl-4-(beta-D-ribofuranosyl)aminobenzene 5'-phosphate synthase
LLHNIKTLKVDLSDVEAIVLSHGHLDHTAATVEVAKAAGDVKIFAHPHTFLPRFHEDKKGKRRKIGVPKGEGVDEIERVGGVIVSTKEPREVAPGLWTTGQIERATTFERALPLSKGERLTINVDGEELNDQILDDQALWMNLEGKGPLVILGCAHGGPVNTLMQVQRNGNFAQIYGLVGGTHLVERSQKYLQQTVNAFRTFRLRLISPCHCTGFKATTHLWRAFPNAFILNFSGRVIEAGKKPDMRIF